MVGREPHILLSCGCALHFFWSNRYFVHETTQESVWDLPSEYQGTVGKAPSPTGTSGALSSQPSAAAAPAQVSVVALASNCQWVWFVTDGTSAGQPA
jgi:hypothetical protein